MVLENVPEEIIKTEIIPWLDIRSKSRLAQCSKLFHRLVGKIRETSRYGKVQEQRKRRIVKLRYNNELLKIINYFPEKDWNWYFISMSSCITLDFMKNNINLPEKFGKSWNYHYFSSNISNSGIFGK